MNKRLLSFTRSMACLLKSGLNVTDSLCVCAEADKDASRIATMLAEKIMEGKSLYEATGEYNSETRNEFSGLYRALLKIGERSGRTEESFARLSEYLERKDVLWRKTVQAALYPSAVLLMTIAAAVFASVYVKPKINAVVEMLSAGEGGSSAVESTAAFPLWIVGAVFVASIISAIVLRKFSARAALEQDKVLATLPAVSRIVCGSETRNFSFAVATMSAGGIPVSEALEESVAAAGNRWYALCLSEFAKRISEGVPFSEAAGRCPVFPPFVRTWLSIGERTGDMERSFGEIYRYFDAQSEGTANVMASLLEPAFILVAGGVAMAFVLRFVVPMLGAIGGL